MVRHQTSDICLRIAQVRSDVAGPRGKAAFAKMLGLAASTYDYYEAGRIPPADVLIRVAQVANVDLQWLLTGQSASGSVSPSEPIVQRVAELVAGHPQALPALSAFLDILIASLKFPAKRGAACAPEANRAPVAATHELLPHREEEPAAEFPAQQADPRESWIPILGRSAAGVPQFWQEQADAETRWQDVIERHARQAQRQMSAVCAADRDNGQQDSDAWLVTTPRPEQGQDVNEFVCARQIKSRYGDAFAVRIDGQSMSPDIEHGDVVVLSPSQPAVDAKPAVVQLRGQIGVTCKIFRREGDRVHLVPVNDQFAPQSFDAQQVVWALRVLAKIKPR